MSPTFVRRAKICQLKAFGKNFNGQFHNQNLSQICVLKFANRCSRSSISSTFYVRIFRTYIVNLAAFFYVRTYVRKKAAEKTFVRKIRAYNVDEIDTCSPNLCAEKSFSSLKSHSLKFWCCFPQTY